MNAYEGENNVNFAGNAAPHSTQTMIPPLMSKVNVFRTAEFRCPSRMFCRSEWWTCRVAGPLPRHSRMLNELPGAEKGVGSISQILPLDTGQ